MSWVRFDDHYPSHRKVRLLSHAAYRLDTSAVMWSSKHRTDGFIPEDDLTLTADLKPNEYVKAVDELVRRDRWEETVGGWRIHDYHDYNPTAEKVAQDKEWNLRRQALSRNPELREAIQRRDENRCRYCGLTVNWADRRGAQGGTYDHVTPRGDDSLENLVVACRSCNSRKGGRTPEQAGMPLLPPGTKP